MLKKFRLGVHTVQTLPNSVCMRHVKDISVCIKWLNGNCTADGRVLSYIGERLILNFYDDFIFVVIIILSSLFWREIIECPKKK